MKRFTPLAGVICGTISFASTIFAPYVPQMAALGLAVLSFGVSALGAAYNWPVPRVPPTE